MSSKLFASKAVSYESGRVMRHKLYLYSWWSYLWHSVWRCRSYCWYGQWFVWQIRTLVLKETWWCLLGWHRFAWWWGRRRGRPYNTRDIEVSPDYIQPSN